MVARVVCSLPTTSRSMTRTRHTSKIILSKSLDLLARSIKTVYSYCCRIHSGLNHVYRADCCSAAASLRASFFLSELSAEPLRAQPQRPDVCSTGALFSVLRTLLLYVRFRSVIVLYASNPYSTTIISKRVPPYAKVPTIEYPSQNTYRNSTMSHTRIAVVTGANKGIGFAIGNSHPSKA